MSNKTRRELMRGAATSLLVLLVGCKKDSTPFACTDTASLSPADTTVRTALGYVEPSSEAGKDCAGCVQFVPAPSDARAACGTCKLMKGPIHPNGYCKAFAPKSA